MKKIVVVLVLVSLLVLPALAQTTFGIKGALGDYSWTGDDWDDMDADNEISLGFSIGGFLEYKLSESLAIQPELLFTYASMKYDNGDEWVKDSAKAIEIPVYIKGLLPLSQGTAYLMAGPDMYYILGDIETDSSISSWEGSTEPDNRVLFGIALSGGYEFESGAFVGLKYSREFTKALDDYDLFFYGIGIEGGMKL